jgi:addiction module HigA family antidote
MNMAANLKGLRAVHPGEILREDVLPALKEGKGEIAALLGLSRQQFYDILKERQPVTPATAVKLGKVLGNGPHLWIALQRDYDLAVAQKKLAKAVSKLPTLHAVA